MQPNLQALLAALQRQQGRGYAEGGKVADKSNIADAIHGIMAAPLSQDTSQFDGSAPMSAAQQAQLPWYQQTHAVLPDAPIPAAEDDPAFQNRFQNVQLPPGIDLGSPAAPRDLAPQWLQDWGS